MTLYIINFTEIVYHQHKVLNIIIAKKGYSLWLMRYTFGDEIHDKRDDMPSLSQWIKKRQVSVETCRFLPMGYEKDIFESFAYEFELSHENDASTSSI